MQLLGFLGSSAVKNVFFLILISAPILQKAGNLVLAAIVASLIEAVDLPTKEGMQEARREVRREAQRNHDALITRFDAMDSKMNAMDSKINAMNSKMNAMDSKMNALNSSIENLISFKH